MRVQPRWVIGLADGTGPGADPGADGASAEKDGAGSDMDGAGLGIIGAGYMLNGAGSILLPEPAPSEVLGRPKCGADVAHILEPAPLRPRPAPLIG